MRVSRTNAPVAGSNVNRTPDEAEITGNARPTEPASAWEIGCVNGVPRISANVRAPHEHAVSTTSTAARAIACLVRMARLVAPEPIDRQTPARAMFLTG